ncbi:winged helix-turn-helix domain-containing protein [Paenibacillus paeoniae]|uniref:ArsR family transcriptional regulator n=1 Tax=Paenibacillus paeoniae TaxID=2292705 RepID=A0A371P5V4_9BACL|nr:helix-turn-helix domain-containing protein [Paenibacillus paeoniae]REK71317.1 ArsR family transcriptional regulator [Paenibacillus paeoniae]
MAVIEKKVLKTIEEIRIFSDPYRMKIMNQYRKTSRPATIKEIADKLGEVPAKVYYHARKLESIGLLELAETKLINGITAKYYTAFEGTIEVNQDIVDDSIKEVYASEAQKLIARTFDESKERYLNNKRSKSAGIALLMNTDLFMTPDEAKDLKAYLEQLTSKYGKKTKPEQSSYHFLSSLSNDPD